MIIKDAKKYSLSFSESIRDEIEKAWMAGYNTAKGKNKNEINLDFVDHKYRQALTTWLSYKKERKQTYTQRGAELCYELLLKLSKNNPDTAMAIVQQSIANNYSGLFALKNERTYTSRQSVAREREDGIDSLTSLAIEILQSSSTKEG